MDKMDLEGKSDQLNQLLSKFIMSNNRLYEKVLLFEPLDIGRVFEDASSWINSQLDDSLSEEDEIENNKNRKTKRKKKKRKRQLDKTSLMDFCDAFSINYTHRESGTNSSRTKKKPRN